jgi:pyruvate,water dikinase
MTNTRSQRDIADDPRAGQPLVAALAAVGRDDLASAGGKGANLGELLRRGFTVPDGFIISTHAYAAVVDDTGLATAIAEQLAGDSGVMPIPRR